MEKENKEKKQSIIKLKKEIETFDIDINKIQITVKLIKDTLKKDKDFKKKFGDLLIGLGGGNISSKKFMKEVSSYVKEKIDTQVFKKAILFCSQYDSEFRRLWYSNSRKLYIYQIRSDEYGENMIEEIYNSLNKLKKLGLIRKKEESA